MRVAPIKSWLADARARELLGAFVLACFAFELVLDFKIVPPTKIDWIFRFYRDTAQYYLSLAYFRNSSWHFPIGSMETMLHPVGASFTLADAIPLLGLPTKALSAVLPVDFQYFGAWLFVSMVLGAVYGKLTLGLLVRSPVLQWVGTAILVLAPPVVHRFPHCHLAAHWLILAAFHSVLAARTLPIKRIWAFSIVSLFVQPYLFVIVSGVLVAAFWLHRRGSRRDLVLGAAGWLGLILLAAWSLGYFGLGKTSAALSDAYYADLTTFVSSLGVSSVVPQLPAHPGVATARTPEGFAYLGLGGILLLAALVTAMVLRLLRRGEGLRLAPAWGVLGLLSLLMAVYAISPSPVVLGHRYPGIEFLTNLLAPIAARLRSTGRFIWPLYYFVLLFGLQALEQLASRWRLAHAVTIAAGVLFVAQFADIGPWLVKSGERQALVRPKRVPPVPQALTGQLPHKKYLVFSPPPARLPCPKTEKEQPLENQGRWAREAYYPYALFGARHGLIVNTDFGATARLEPEQHARVCEYALKLRLAASLPPDVLLVTLPEGTGTDDDVLGADNDEPDR